MVENIIEIQKLLFIPNLNVNISGLELINDKYRVPVGIIQIPVENALLHGLRNKEIGECKLEIKILDFIDNYHICINDNGVGRNKATLINNFKKNGNGLKTIYEMIAIINSNKSNSIKFHIDDLQNDLGTKVTIQLNKNIDYDKIKL